MKKHLTMFIGLMMAALLAIPAAQAQIKLKTLDKDAAAAKEAEELEKYEAKMKEMGLSKIEVKLPKPMFVGTPKTVKLPNLEPMKKRKPIYAPEGVKNLALNKPITSSDEEPIIGDLDLITDGDKEGADGSFVELGPGKQWVQIDLGAKAEIFHVLTWHYHQEGRAYKGIVVQVADDKDFIENVQTIYNNDDTNVNGLGAGKNRNYIETNEGYRTGPAEGKTVKGRFVRLYSNGNTSSDMNHYIEVEVYGRPVE